MDNQDIDHIDKYLLSKLSAEEKIAFEQKMSANKELANEVASHKETMAYVEGMADAKMKEEIAAIDVNVDEVWNESDEVLEKSISQKKSTIKPMYAYLTVAASIALLVGLSIIFSQNNNAFTALTDKHYKVYSIGTKGVDNKTEAERLYSNKLYKDAIPLLKQCGNVEPECNLMLGIAYYEQENFDKAIQTFETIESTDRLHINNSRWYAALTYLQLNHPFKAKESLKMIINNKDAGKKLIEKAEQLLSDLNAQMN